MGALWELSGSSLGALWELSGSSLGALWELVAVAGIGYIINCFQSLLLWRKKAKIPKRLASLKGQCPICIPCLFGKAHERPWHSKSKESHPIQKKSDNYPGARASMDYLVSSQPGLIPQITGKLTSQQIHGATVIVDHHSDHGYVYLMINSTLDETLFAKHAYERFLSSIRVTAKANHADNG